MIWKQCEEMLMLALQSYEQASGFSVLTADELNFINGGSGEGENNNQNDNSQKYKSRR